MKMVRCFVFIALVVLSVIFLLSATAKCASAHHLQPVVTAFYLEHSYGLPFSKAAQYASATISAAIEFDIPVSILAAQVVVESSVNPKARSYVGALGLIQVMPFWVNELPDMGVNVRNSADLYDPYISLMAGAAIYAHYFYTVGEGNVFDTLAAYNAGPSKKELGAEYAKKVLELARKISI